MAIRKIADATLFSLSAPARSRGVAQPLIPLLAALCVLLLLSCRVLADPDVNQIKSEIGSANAADRGTAATQISDTLKNGAFTRQFMGTLRDQLLPAMAKAGMNDEVADLAQKALLAQPLNAAAFQRLRLRALIAANHPDEALVAAKIYFNVCPIADTSRAIEFLGRCLSAAKGKDDPDIVQRFRAEQMAGAATQPDAAATTQPAGPTSRESSILKSIVIDPKPYEAVLPNFDGENYSAVIANGNLLLMADRSKEAEQVFRQELNVAEDKDIARVEESIARAIRAEDGTIGRANEYIAGLGAQTLGQK